MPLLKPKPASVPTSKIAFRPTPAPTPTPARLGRWPDLDFYRGVLALWLSLEVSCAPFIAVAAVCTEFWQPLGLFTMAEGFVFLSGFCFPLAYWRESTVDWSRMRSRALRYYAIHVSLVVGAFVLAHVNPVIFLKTLPYRAMVESPLPTLAKSLFLLFTPRGLDVLPLYLLLLPIGGLALQQIHRGRADIVLMVSALVWLGCQQDESWFQSFGGPSGFSTLNPLAWQFLFVIGLWASVRGRETLAILPSSVRRLLPAVALAIVGTGFAIRRDLFPPITGGLRELVYAPRRNLPPYSLVTFLGLCQLLALSLLPHRWISAPLSQWLSESWGRRSLLAYSWVAVLWLILLAFQPRVLIQDPTGFIFFVMAFSPLIPMKIQDILSSAKRPLSEH